MVDFGMVFSIRLIKTTIDLHICGRLAILVLKVAVITCPFSTVAEKESEVLSLCTAMGGSRGAKGA